MSLESGSAQRTHIRIRMIRIPMGQKKEGAKKDPWMVKYSKLLTSYGWFSLEDGPSPCDFEVSLAKCAPYTPQISCNPKERLSIPHFRKCTVKSSFNPSVGCQVIRISKMLHFQPEINIRVPSRRLWQWKDSKSFIYTWTCQLWILPCEICYQIVSENGMVSLLPTPSYLSTWLDLSDIYPGTIRKKWYKSYYFWGVTTIF